MANANSSTKSTLVYIIGVIDVISWVFGILIFGAVFVFWMVSPNDAYETFIGPIILAKSGDITTAQTVYMVISLIIIGFSWLYVWINKTLLFDGVKEKNPEKLNRWFIVMCATFALYLVSILSHLWNQANGNSNDEYSSYSKASMAHTGLSIVYRIGSLVIVKIFVNELRANLDGNIILIPHTRFDCGNKA